MKGSVHCGFFLVRGRVPSSQDASGKYKVYRNSLLKNVVPSSEPTNPTRTVARKKNIWTKDGVERDGDSLSTKFLDSQKQVVY